MRTILSIVALAFLAASCSSANTPGPGAPPTVFGGDRPTTLQSPASYDGTTAMPLLIILHGYSATGGIQEAYLGANALVDSANVFVLAPDGTFDTGTPPKRFWNATDGCCNFYGSTVDDVGYLKGLIHDVKAAYKIDPKRVYLWGHSNGAFMAHRMACEDSAEIAGIAAIAGATWQNATRCTPANPVSILDIHSDHDMTISYSGNTGSYPYPSETTTMTRWQGYDSCIPGLVDSPTMIDLVTNLAGNETKVSRFTGCSAGTGVELWTMVGDMSPANAHIPNWTPGFASRVWVWLTAHPKP